jgi:NADPH:quinone reductase-like Zn-dependent oxidoreductase
VTKFNIKLRAAGMNPMDRQISDGGWKARMPGTFPLVLGVDVAAFVEGVGDHTTWFSPGYFFGQLLIGIERPEAEDAGAQQHHDVLTRLCLRARLAARSYRCGSR